MGGLAWATGALVVGLVALSAGLNLAGRLNGVWARFPGPLGLRGVFLVALVVALAAAGLWGIKRLWRSGRLSGVALPVGLGLIVVTRGIAVAVVDAPLASDPLFLHELAVGVTEGACCFAHRPMGYPLLLGLLYGAFGVHVWLGELLNLAASLITGWLLYIVVQRAWGPFVGAIAIYLYAIAPAQTLLTPVILTETVYGALLLAAVVTMTGAVRGPLVLSAATGLLLALSQYVRATSLALLPAFALLPALVLPARGMPALRPAFLRVVLLAATFIAALIPVAIHNATQHGELSLSTSSYAGWSLFVGANQKHNGRWNAEDAALLAGFPGSTWWDRSEVAGELGLMRITDDPGGFAALALRKFPIMWGDESYGVSYALTGSRDVGAAETLTLLSQAFYAVVTAAAFATLLRDRRARSPAALLIVLIVITVAGVHTLLEVTGRYHAYLVPLFCALASSSIALFIEPRPRPAR